MTYGDIYKQFYDKFPNAEVDDWRPADPLFIPQLLKPIPNAILVWLKGGNKLVFISEEVGETD